MKLLIRDAGINDVVSAIFGNVSDSVEQQNTMFELALAKAKDLQDQGKEVLFLVLNHIALYEPFVARLKAASNEDVGTTTLYFGGETVGAEPAFLADLDALITFDFGRAKRGLYPAVDPINSALVSCKKERLAKHTKRSQPRRAACFAVIKIYSRLSKAADLICFLGTRTERSLSAPTASTAS